MDRPRSYVINRTDLLRQLLYLPNILSLSRVLLLPFIWYFVQKQTDKDLAIGFCLIIILLTTDALDGYLAKKLRLTSKLGLILDPVCDKIAALVLLLLLITYADFPLGIFFIVLIRDFLILCFNWFFAIRVKAVFRSDFFGRWAFIFLSITIVVYAAKWLSFELVLLQQSLLVIVTILIVASSIQYLRNFYSEWAKYNRVKPKIKSLKSV